jgi:hypothetical protein
MAEVDIKTAVSVAKAFLAELFPDKAKDILLEEVERVGDNWLITLSFPGRDVTLFGTPLPSQAREYKTVEVDATTGKPKSVKIRVLNA